MSKKIESKASSPEVDAEAADPGDDLPAKVENAGADALEQAAIYAALVAPITLRFDDGTTADIPPDPRLRVLDDDRLAAWDALQFEKKSYDRMEDIITVIEEREIKDQHGNVIATIPASTRTDPGPLLFPFQKDGELITPPWEVKEVVAVLGQEKYDLLRTKFIGGERVSVQHIYREWRQMDARLRDRQAEDSKSDGGPVDLEAVPEADSE